MTQSWSDFEKNMLENFTRGKFIVSAEERCKDFLYNMVAY